MQLSLWVSPLMRMAQVVWSRTFSRKRKRERDWLSAGAERAARSRTDTVAAWPPQAARVLTDAEAEALDLARRAAPKALVLAQVPLWRFVRVSSRQSYSSWLNRVGFINADLLICDAQGTVQAVVDVYREPMSERSQRRHERLRRVLRATGTPVLIWQQGRLPSVVKVRAQLGSHGVDCSERDAPGSTGLESRREAPLTAPSRARMPVHEAVSSDFHGFHAAPSTIL